MRQCEHCRVGAETCRSARQTQLRHTLQRHAVTDQQSNVISNRHTGRAVKWDQEQRHCLCRYHHPTQKVARPACLAYLWVRTEQAPVHVRPVAQVWVVCLICGTGQHQLDHALHIVCWLFEEQLHGGSQQLQLDLRARSVGLRHITRWQELGCSHSWDRELGYSHANSHFTALNAMSSIAPAQHTQLRSPCWSPLGRFPRRSPAARLRCQCAQHTPR